MGNLLDVRNLKVEYPTRFGLFTAIREIDLSIGPGEIHGLVGESGAGKSTIGAAVMGLIPKPGYIAEGTIELAGENLRALSDEEYHKVRGSRISMIFQDPQTSLNPLLTIEEQMVETILQHSDIHQQQAFEQAVALLEETGIQSAGERIKQYPHQFSGGMRQRVVIALALCTDPQLIIADEPTTALDVAIQKQILLLIRKLADDRGVGFVLITHDIGVIAEITDTVSVLRNGRLVERGSTRDVLGAPGQEYTKSLMAAVPRLDRRLERFSNIITEEIALSAPELSWRVSGASDQFAVDWLLKGDQSQMQQSPVLSFKDVDVVFEKPSLLPWKKTAGFHALKNVSFDVNQGEVVGLIGESGSGKSTIAKTIVGLVSPTGGAIKFNGSELPNGNVRSRNDPSRRDIQLIFQDPYSSLNNRRTIEKILTEPIRFFGLAESATEKRRIVASILDLVELPQRAMLKYPHQFSGGQRQRIAIARALLARPRFLICDEPTSALDVSIQAQVLNLLKDLQEKFGLTILFISHDLAVVRQMADRLVVLKDGEVVESGGTEQFFNGPENPYSAQLLAETPSLELIANI